MDKMYRILDAMKAAAERDSHSGLWAEYEDYLSELSRYGAWEQEGRRYGEPRPDRPTQKDLMAALTRHGYRYNSKSGLVQRR